MASVAAIGLRLHSGWAASVLVAQDSAKAPALIARRRIILCEPPSAKQPYHAAEIMELREAEAFITACRITTIALAVEALERLGAKTGGLGLAGVGLVGVGIVASSPRKLPALSAILHSHPLIHAAEGVFYREAMIEAAKRAGLKSRTITGRVASAFLGRARDLRETLQRIGKAAGPPWTMDEKCASLAAFSFLPGPARKFHLEALDQPVR
ncbi:MAG TPA: hypothetical protein VN935_03685 [Rhizomicrobium sp.]|nr:hypothetical protein [Rhizomicrobium sp.]